MDQLIPIPDAEWHAKTYGAYARESTEAYENAICVYNLLSSLGWTLAAVCAFWGNVEAESGYNPWRWEGDNVLSSNELGTIESSTVHGYGLVQFTPAGKYILSENAEAFDGFGPNYSDWSGSIYDGDAQCRFIDAYADYIPNPNYDFQISFDEFRYDDYTAGYLAKAWLHNYERPRVQTPEVEEYRASIANYWFNVLNGYEPTEPIPPTPGGGNPPIPVPGSTESRDGRKFKIGLYLKPFYKRL